MSRLVVITFVVLSTLIAPACADIINVPADQPTIQAGIDAAVDGDEVVVANGVWSGPGNRDITLNGKAITVRSSGGRQLCIIDCQGLGRGFFFNAGEAGDSVVAGFLIANGQATSGGGIYIQNSSPTIQQCEISNCSATSGGGMYVNNGSPQVIDVIFSGNSCTSNGAAMHNTNGSEPMVDLCVFIGNDAAGFGGGMANISSNPTVINCGFDTNEADVGGGIYNQNSDPQITACGFDANIAARFGGGMTNSGSNPIVFNSQFRFNTSGQGGGGCASSSGSAPEFTNCEFTENSSLDGGGVFNLNITTPITGCTFDNNSASRFGGAIYNSRSSLPVIATTIDGCTAGATGGGIYNTFSNPLIGGSIIRNCTPNQILDDSNSTSTVDHSNILGGWSGPGNIDQDPLFVAPDDGNFRLMPGSPCIDAGNNILVLPGTFVDIYGDVRYVDDPDTTNSGIPGGDGKDAIIDMGAAEFQPDDCPADFNGDGFVNTLDFLAFLNAFSSGDPSADFNGDGTVNTLDFLAFLNAFNTGCG